MCGQLRIEVSNDGSWKRSSLPSNLKKSEPKKPQPAQSSNSFDVVKYHNETVQGIIKCSTLFGG